MIILLIVQVLLSLEAYPVSRRCQWATYTRVYTVYHMRWVKFRNFWHHRPYAFDIVQWGLLRTVISTSLNAYIYIQGCLQSRQLAEFWKNIWLLPDNSVHVSQLAARLICVSLSFTSKLVQPPDFPVNIDALLACRSHYILSLRWSIASLPRVAPERLTSTWTDGDVELTDDHQYAPKVDVHFRIAGPNGWASRACSG